MCRVEDEDCGFSPACRQRRTGAHAVRLERPDLGRAAQRVRAVVHDRAVVDAQDGLAARDEGIGADAARVVDWALSDASVSGLAPLPVVVLS